MIEDDLRRTAEEARSSGRTTVAGELADLVAEVRRCAGDLLVAGFAGIVAKIEALDEVAG